MAATAVGSGGASVRHPTKLRAMARRTRQRASRLAGYARAAGPRAPFTSRGAPDAIGAGGIGAPGGGDETADAGGIDGRVDVAVVLERRADDGAVGDREQLGDGLRRGAAADEQPDARRGAPHALEIVERRGRPRHATGDDQAVRQSAVHQVTGLELEVERCQRRGVLAADVGVDLHRGAQEPAVTQSVVGVGLHEALIGDDGAGVDVDPDEAGADRARNGQRGARVALEHVDAERRGGAGPPDLVGDHGEGGDRGGLDPPRRERGVAPVLDEHRVHAAIHQRARVGERGGDDALHGAGPARAARQRRDVDHADQAHRRKV